MKAANYPFKETEEQIGIVKNLSTLLKVSKENQIRVVFAPYYTDLNFILKQHGIEYIALAGMRANTFVDSPARYGVKPGYRVTLIKNAIGAFNFEEIKATVETNLSNHEHKLLSTGEFVELINKQNYGSHS